MNAQTTTVGTPATINLYSDRLPAVVTKVNPKSIIVTRVEADETTKRVTNPGEPFPCIVMDGDITKITGTGERYMLKGHREDGSPIYRNGSISITLGRSVKVTDYRY